MVASCSSHATTHCSQVELLRCTQAAANAMPAKSLVQILAWDSYFHLWHEARRTVFGVFDAHASDKAVLLVNTGPGHGEAESTFTFERERLYNGFTTNKPPPAEAGDDRRAAPIPRSLLLKQPRGVKASRDRLRQQTVPAAERAQIASLFQRPRRHVPPISLWSIASVKILLLSGWQTSYNLNTD